VLYLTDQQILSNCLDPSYNAGRLLVMCGFGIRDTDFETYFYPFYMPVLWVLFGYICSGLVDSTYKLVLFTVNRLTEIFRLTGFSINRTETGNMATALFVIAVDSLSITVHSSHFVPSCRKGWLASVAIGGGGSCCPP